MRPVLPILVIAALAAGAPGGLARAESRLAAADATVAAGPVPSCETALAAAEWVEGLPPGLLQAIGRVEAGGRGRIWPWALNIGGESHYPASREAALALARRALAENPRRNLDLGCGQIHWQSHRGRLRSLEAALDPAINAAYAGWLLGNLHRHTGSWRAAVGRYHSPTAGRQAAYVARVLGELCRDRRYAADAGCRRR